MPNLKYTFLLVLVYFVRFLLNGLVFFHNFSLSCVNLMIIHMHYGSRPWDIDGISQLKLYRLIR